MRCTEDLFLRVLLQGRAEKCGGRKETEISSERDYSSSREEFGLKMESITLCSSSGSTEDTGHRGRIAGVMPLSR